MSALKKVRWLIFDLASARALAWNAAQDKHPLAGALIGIVGQVREPRHVLCRMGNRFVQAGGVN